MKTYIENLLLGIDQLFNAFLFGYPDETISARAYRLHKYFFWYWLMQLIDTLFFWKTHHCQQSFFAEKLRRQLPPEYRK